MRDTLTRIAIFYDGNFFHVVSNYYAYSHPRQARISIRGLHDFIRAHVAREEHVEARSCQVVDVHYFRGRFSADEALAAGKLHADRLFDDVLIREGVTTHYLPMGVSGTEKGIDVWFALEAYELAIHERFDVCVLIAGDSDYVPLVRKLNSLGIRVMVVGWDFEYKDRGDRTQTTKTSQALLGAVTYPVLLSSVIEDETRSAEVKGLFLPSTSSLVEARPSAESEAASADTAAMRQAATRQAGKIQNLIMREAESKAFGYITPNGGSENVWFGDRDLEDVTFDMLARGDAVTFELGSNWNGSCAKRVRREG